MFEEEFKEDGAKIVDLETAKLVMSKGFCRLGVNFVSGKETIMILI